MGKRKRRTDRNKTPPSPGFMSQASQMESSLKEKSSHSFGSTGVKPMQSSLTNIVERSPNGHHHSAAHHRHHNLNRALLLRVPRHCYSVQHSHRNSSNHPATSASHGKTALRDDKLPWKFGHRLESRSGYHAERRDMASRKLDRIRSNLLSMDESSPEVMNTLCGLCQMTLKTKHRILGSAESTIDLSVVAVLVCGHAFHADCLETRTSYEDRRDPPCPLCMHSGFEN